MTVSSPPRKKRGLVKCDVYGFFFFFFLVLAPRLDRRLQREADFLCAKWGKKMKLRPVKFWLQWVFKEKKKKSQDKDRWSVLYTVSGSWWTGRLDTRTQELLSASGESRFPRLGCFQSQDWLWKDVVSGCVYDPFTLLYTGNPRNSFLKRRTRFCVQDGVVSLSATVSGVWAP